MAWRALRCSKYNGVRISWLDLDGVEGPQYSHKLTWSWCLGRPPQMPEIYWYLHKLSWSWWLGRLAWKPPSRAKYNDICLDWLDLDGLGVLRRYKYIGIHMNWLHFDSLESSQMLQICIDWLDLDGLGDPQMLKIQMYLHELAWSWWLGRTSDITNIMVFA